MTSSAQDVRKTATGSRFRRIQVILSGVASQGLGLLFASVLQLPQVVAASVNSSAPEAEGRRTPMRTGASRGFPERNTKTGFLLREAGFDLELLEGLEPPTC